MQLIPQGYIARYNLEDLYQLVNENLKKLGKELVKPEPVSSVVNGKTVWSFEARDLPGKNIDKPKKKYNYSKKPKPEQVLAESDYSVGYSYVGSNYEKGERLEGEVLAGPVRPL